MLHKEAVTGETLALIRKLSADPACKDFNLVGGTALALQLGHRTSVDIDFFTRAEFDVAAMLEHLEKEYRFALQFQHKNTLKGFIDGVFLDLLKHDYPYIEDPITMEGVRMLSMADIAAMKVNAITGDGTRIMDFIDIYFLLDHFTFGEIIDYYSTKYQSRNTFHAVKSITYFDDITEADRPLMILEKDLKLKAIKSKLVKARDRYLREG